MTGRRARCVRRATLARAAAAIGLGAARCRCAAHPRAVLDAAIVRVAGASRSRASKLRVVSDLVFEGETSVVGTLSSRAAATWSNEIVARGMPMMGRFGARVHDA